MVEDDDEYDVVWDEIQTLFGLEGRQMSMKAEKLCPRSKDFLVKNQLQEGIQYIILEQSALEKGEMECSLLLK